MIFVDSHVHIYDCYNLEAFFDSAWANFKLAAANLVPVDELQAILLLTETTYDNWFDCISDSASGSSKRAILNTGKWKILSTKEAISLILLKSDTKKLYIIAGRQIQSAEGLELLALGVNGDFKDGLPMAELIRMVDSAGGISVVPWGFGKWYGRRGRYLRQMLNSPENRQFFIGDNSGRPGFLPEPSIFKSIRNSKVTILPGSDPLPFPAEYNRAGSFGLFAQTKISDNYPARDIKKIILNPEKKLRPYGNLEKPLRFIRNQMAMQIRKRFKN